jgi:hypothetical protein
MPVTCTHGLDETFCATCPLLGEAEPLRRDALRVTKEGKPVLILRTLRASLSVSALILEGTTLRFETFREMDLRHPMTVIPFNPQKILRLFLDLALQKALVSQTNPELSAGEPMASDRSRIGPAPAPSGPGTESLVCTQCGGVVHRCGCCLCGSKGKKHTGPKKSSAPFPISREERMEVLRAVLFCIAPIETRPKAKVLRFPRKKTSVSS